MPLSEVDGEAAGSAASASCRKCVACSQMKSKENFSKRQWGAKPSLRKCCLCVSGEKEKEDALAATEQEKPVQLQDAGSICGRCRVKVAAEEATCGACKAVRYCSKACQEEDSELHKVLCFKVQGNTKFSQGHFRDAAFLYRKGSDSARAQGLTSPSTAVGADARELLVVLLSNEAQCYLNLHDYMLAMRTADEALAHNPAHVKSRHRLALARQALGREEEAQVRTLKSQATKFQRAGLDRRLYYRNTVFPAELPTVQVYQRLIDAYRVGLREEFINGGDGDLRKCGLQRKLTGETALGAEETPLEEGPIQHFMRFVARGRSTEPDSDMSDFDEEEGVLEQTVCALPLWWNDTDDSRVKEMAMRDTVFGIGLQFDEAEIDRRYARVKTKSWHPDGPGYDSSLRMALRDLAQDIGFYEGAGSDDDGDDDDDCTDEEEEEEEEIEDGMGGGIVLEQAPQRAPEPAAYRAGGGVSGCEEVASGSDMARDWWRFDASAYKVNGKWHDGAITVANWARFGPWASCQKLHLNIAGTFSLRGVERLFGGLTALVVDDAEECMRIKYDLKGLAHLAPTLTHLELRMSGQWMAEGSGCLSPLTTLSNLRSLRVEHLRDGERVHLKAFEKLRRLEHLWYSGNNVDYGWAGGAHACHHLDLSHLSQLKAIVFASAQFCDVSERPPEAAPPKKKRSAPKRQCLSVPTTLNSISFVGPDPTASLSAARRERDSSCSDVLRAKLVEQRVLVELVHAPHKFAESWRAVVIDGRPCPP